MKTGYQNSRFAHQVGRQKINSNDVYPFSVDFETFLFGVIPGGTICLPVY